MPQPAEQLTKNYHLPLTQLFGVLQQHGFVFGVDTFESIHWIIQKVFETGNFDNLDLWLCPVIAKTAEEQQLFYEVYHRFFQPETKIRIEELPKKKDGKTVKIKPPPKTDKKDSESEEDTAEIPKERTKVVASLTIRNAKPIYIEQFVSETKVEPDTRVLKTARQMRFTQAMGKRTFDVKATIQKSIRKNGYANPVWAHPHRHAEYIMLIEQESTRDHRSLWHNRIFEIMLANNITVERFFFHTMPLTCINEKYSKGISIHQILNIYQHAVLMVFANGKQFFNVCDMQPLKWASVFEHWENRFFFPHDPVHLWGLREKILQQIFPVVLPSNPGGLQALTDYFSKKSTAELFTLSFWAQKSDYAHHPFDTNEETLEEISLFLKPSIRQWIAACAVYPELNWGLTLVLGKKLSDNQPNLLTQSNISQLLRLDWFSDGRIPDKSRNQLIEQWLLPHEYRKVNRIIYKQLNQLPTGDKEDSDFKLQLAVHELLGEGDPQKIKELDEKLKLQYEKTDARPDWISLHRINESEISHLHFEIPQYILDKWDLPKSKKETKHFVLVKGGTFMMGSSENDKDAQDNDKDVQDNEKPRHEVELSDFYIGKTPVTQQLWKEVMGKDNNPSEFKGDDLPVEQLSWYDAVEFCNKLSEKEGKKPCYNIDKNTEDPNNKYKEDKLKWKVELITGAKGYRLPTEAEWEYAARGGNKSKGYIYAGSNEIDEVAWYEKNSDKKTHQVGEKQANELGEKQANELGIYDMSGNVREWCWDWYDEKYYEESKSKGEFKNPRGPQSGSIRVLRGGSWFILALLCRVAYRGYDYPDLRYDNLGLRLVFVP